MCTACTSTRWRARGTPANIIFCGDGNPRFLLKFAAVYGIFRAYSDHMFVILDRNEARGSAITVLKGPTRVTGIRIEARRRCSNLLVDHLAEMVSAQDAPGQRFAAV